tara:strand:+ start:106 stop:708 length:603 start_codon:yes stop_codon:yes gene_type:complete
MANIAKATKLAAVNTIISNIGQAPVTTLETGNPLVEMAEQILNEISRSVQSEGWVFNTEFHYPFGRDGNKFIRIPENVLALDTARTSTKRATIRNHRLYDKVNHTYEWDDDMELDVIWLWPFEEMPEAFKNYVTIRAANVFAGRSIGSTEAVKFGEREEIFARSSAIEHDTQQGDYTIFADKNNDQSYQSYLPFNAIRRY